MKVGSVGWMESRSSSSIGCGFGIKALDWNALFCNKRIYTEFLKLERKRLIPLKTPFLRPYSCERACQRGYQRVIALIFEPSRLLTKRDTGYDCVCLIALTRIQIQACLSLPEL